MASTFFTGGFLHLSCGCTFHCECGGYRKGKVQATPALYAVAVFPLEIGAASSPLRHVTVRHTRFQIPIMYNKKNLVCCVVKCV